MTRLTMDDHATPPTQTIQPNFQLQDYDSFPALQPTNSNPYDQTYDSPMLNSPQSQPPTVSTLNPFAMFVPSSNASVQSSRPNSRHQSRTATPSTLAVNDDEAFPTLGSAAASRSSRRHGKRGHGNTAKESPVPTPSSLADVVRMTPSPSPQIQSRRGLRSSKSNTGSRENSAAAMAIAAPEHIPWLETGESANKAYLKARAEAFRHGGLRNKFLQSAATVSQDESTNTMTSAVALICTQNPDGFYRNTVWEGASQISSHLPSEVVVFLPFQPCKIMLIVPSL